MTSIDGLPVLRFADIPKLRVWFEAHHHSARGFWAELAKKGHTERTVSYAEVLDEALAFGWIDGQKRGGVEEGFFLQRFTPRKPKSTWSQINREHVARLEREGRMTDAGRAAVEAARADGRWDAAYAGAKSAEVPPDLAAALAREPEARAFFETLRGASRYAFLHRLATAPSPESRARRLERFVAMMRAGEAFHAEARPAAKTESTSPRPAKAAKAPAKAAKAPAKAAKAPAKRSASKRSAP